MFCIILLCLTAATVILQGEATIDLRKFGKAPRINKSYTVYTDKQVNWHEAYIYCERMNMTLASFDSEQEYNQLVKQIKRSTCGNTGGFWTAGYLTQEGGVRWLVSGKPLQFTPWCPGHPPPDRRVRLVALRPDYHYKLIAEFMPSQNYIACEKKSVDRVLN
uniref:C-type lectin domain-containing protein n=1 Tax=Graphocephala atropunctata TaxID=36148 RepID=A0A1B6LVN8_9HEMI